MDTLLVQDTPEKCPTNSTPLHPKKSLSPDATIREAEILSGSGT